MAELSKFKHSEVINILKHNLRLTKINSILMWILTRPI